MMSPTTNVDNGNPTPPENMSVKELREWLKTFGKQHKEHFEKNQVQKRRSPTSTPTKKTPSMSVRDRVMGLQHELQEKPVSTSTSCFKKVTNENECPSDEANSSLPTPRKLDASPSPKSDINEDPARDISLAQSKSSELPEAPSFQEDDLCLTLSAVSMATSYEEEEEVANESIVEEDSFDMANFQHTPYSLPPVEESKEEIQAVPAEWSDLESNNFDTSIEASSGTDKEDSDNEGSFASPSTATWPTWDKRNGGDGNARDYLKKQSISPFQGNWSDNDCDDDDYQGGGLNNNSARARRAEDRRSLGMFSLETTYEDTESNFTLADAARGSVSVAEPRSKKPSLSDFFMVQSTKKSPPKQQTNQSMHDANLFDNKMMTAGALDLICDDKAASNAAPESDLETFFNHDQGTVSSASATSEDSGKPSVAPNAVDEKLSKVFSTDTENTESLTVCSTPEKRHPTQARQPVQARSYEEPDKRQEASPAASVCDTPSDTSSSGKKKDASPKKTPSSAFTSVIQMFGGGSGSGKKATRKTRVESRKEQLEEQWAATRAVKFNKKNKWRIGSSPGIYKKRVVLEYEDKK